MAAGGVGAGGGQFLRRLDQPRLPRLQRQLDTDVGRARVTRRGGRVGFRSAPTWELSLRWIAREPEGVEHKMGGGRGHKGTG